MSSVLSTDWIYDEDVKFLNDKIVIDINAIGDSVYVLTTNELILIHDNNYKTYYVNNNSVGLLDNYKYYKSQKTGLNSIVVNNKSLFLISKDLKNILELKNNFILNHSINIKDNAYYNTSFFIDSMLVVSYKYITNSYKNHLINLNNEEITVYNELDIFNKESPYIILNNDIYFYELPINFKSKSNSFIIYYDKRKSIYANNIGQNNKPNIYNNYIILIDNKSNCIFYPYDSKLSIIEKKLINDYSELNYDYIVIKDKIFLTSSKGLYIINANTFNIIKTKPKYFNLNCMFGFDKIFVHKNILWLIYGIGIKYDCNKSNFGIAKFNALK